jgi:flagellar motility protein MotE (MotC chaperone)
MVCELSYINSKSLLFLGNEFGAIDKLFAVVGSMAFSMVTVLVMRKSRERWIKVVFPLFDALLVFCGFNLQFAAQIASGHDNPVRLLLSVFMAVFTGLITYSLGLINYTDHVADANDSKRYAEDVERIKAETSRIIDEIQEQKSYLDAAVDDSNSKVTELTSLLEAEQTKRKRYEKAAKDFMANHICFLAWGAKKKNESNRTPDETKAITLAEKIKAGESVKLEEVLA